MLSNQLRQAQCNDPFGYLGLLPNNDGKGFVLRAWQPGATEISAKPLKGRSKKIELECIDEEGLFEAILPDVKELFAYKLIITAGGQTFERVDPYLVHHQAMHHVHHLYEDVADTYSAMGAQFQTADVHGHQVEGVRFAVYAPNASAISLVGDFNGWDGRVHPLQKLHNGCWCLFVPGLEAGARYKYEVKDPLGNRLPHKADPYGYSADQYPSHASILYDHSTYEWQDQDWQTKNLDDKRFRPMSIYEVHLGSWRKVTNEDGTQRSLTYKEMVEQLIPYVKDLGYTHLELMPVSEHPFDGSWGYQPVGMFAPTSRFGNPDEFKYFVDQCHANDIGVIVDWVPAHFPDDSHGVARFDGTHLYEYSDPRKGWHPDWNSCIYDFGRDHVRQFLVANALYWIDYFHIDGLRVDAVASMLYLDYSRNDGEWIPNVDGGNQNYEAISLLRWFNEEVYKRHPHAMTIAEESTAFPGVSRPTFMGGLGFGFKWNMGWMHDSLNYIQKDPAYRRFHHGEMTFSMIYAFDENFILPLSHDEVVHGKNSLLYKMPGDEWQQAANLRCYTGFMWGHPGKKLNFMGNEIAQGSEWNHDISLSWHLLDFPRHEGQLNLTRALNNLYRNEPALYELDVTGEGFEWVEHEDAENSTLAFIRKAKSSDEQVIVVSNFTPIPREGYRLGVNVAGRYEVVLNTDSKEFWGSGYDVAKQIDSENKAWHGREQSIVLDLPPLSTIFIKCIP
ncbi:1,4-alpha-glucan branching protein GlgB [Echinimonas agarilytica]|uniref:1,4-alpha-glucan branching enzyme GlgB n=1 Tax=Echinimonas agarilytica TaxID=1215918 RepID=A0AA41W6Q2_9GAMM|nr:1,4-alpha-glucan branching protein GlgB [Echinimonas agarilytica]MCM2679468.1 1,4-alpha-glucan branching protein GlgB [Echinimonas agarilytica]